MGLDTGSSSETNTQSFLVPQISKYKMKENYTSYDIKFSNFGFVVWRSYCDLSLGIA